MEKMVDPTSKPNPPARNSDGAAPETIGSAPSRHRRKLAAILCTDARDYSRLMGEDEGETVRTIKACFRMMSELIGTYGGRVVDSSGDNLLAEFPSVVDAVRCAVEIQENLKARNEELPPDRRMLFRIGINLGDVIEEDGRLYGDGVIVAARIEQLAEGGGVCISRSALDQVRNKLPLGYEDIGEYAVKNIPEPVRIYRVIQDVSAQRRRARRLAAGPWRTALLAAFPGVIVAAFGALLWNASMKPPPIPVEIAAADRPEPPRVANGPQSLEPSAKHAAAVRSAEDQRPARAARKVRSEKLPGVPLPDPPSIAVIPFENMSGDPDQEYLSDGLTDDIITTLSKLPRLFVISRSSTQTYKKKPAKVEQISRDLGVRYVLEGSIQRSGTQIRVNAQLIDGATGKHVWAERYDRDEGDLFKTRDALILDIAAALLMSLTDGDVAQIVRRNTNSLEAWEALQRGHQFYERYVREDNLRGREWYQKAAELDPKYVNAWMMIGWTYYLEARSFVTGEERERAFAKALEMADKVLEMDPSYYGSYFLRGGVYMRQGRHEEGVANFRKAAAMEPNNTFAVAMLASAVAYWGQPEEAIVLYKQAMRLSPYYRPWYLEGLGLAYHLTGEHEKAIETYKVAAERDPKSVYPHLRLAVMYAEQGRDDEMRSEAAEVLRRNPKFSVEAWTKVHVFKDPKIHEQRKALMLKAGLPD